MVYSNGRGSWLAQLCEYQLEYFCGEYTCGRYRLDGCSWILQAVRAVNQAMGRVIRHKHDYGAIIMCDRRFADHGMQKQVSLWLRSLNQVHRNFGSAISTLTKFFRVSYTNQL